METGQRGGLDFTQPVEADFVVAKRRRMGGSACSSKPSPGAKARIPLHYTHDIREALRMSRFRAEDVALEVEEYRCTDGLNGACRTV